MTLDAAQPLPKTSSTTSRIARLARMFLDWGAGAVVAAVCLGPLIRLTAEGVSLVNVAAESVGYRYFNSLRILYGIDDRPWTPQGHVLGLLHLGLQTLLTAFGLAPTQLQPRLDWYLIIGTALPHLLLIPAFVWAVRPMGSPLAPLLLAAGYVLMAWERTAGGGWHLAGPDYYPWSGLAALVLIGWMVRRAQSPARPALKDAVLAGVFGGLCLAGKPTWITFVIPLAALLVLRAGSIWQACLLACITTIVTLGSAVLVVLAYYLGNVRATLNHFPGLIWFGAAVENPVSFPTWAATLLPTGTPPSLPGLILLLPIVLALGTVLFQHRAVSAGLLAGSLVSLAVTYRRFTSQTLIETGAFTLAALAIWLALVLGPWAASAAGRLIPWPVAHRGAVLIVQAVFLVWLAGLAMERNGGSVPAMLAISRASIAGERALDEFLSENPGRTLFLIPDNNYALPPVHQAIYKGAMNLDRPRWTDSPLMMAMFPDRWYAYGGGLGQDEPPGGIGSFGNLAFMGLASRGGAADAWMRIGTDFGIDPVQYECPLQHDMRTGHSDWQIVFGCIRRARPAG